MATIPRQQAQQPLETGRVVSYPTGTPVGAALSDVGSSVTSAGLRLQAQQQEMADRAQRQQDQLDTFKLGIGEKMFDSQLSATLDASQQAMPADGTGFHDAFVGEMNPATGEASKPGAFDDVVKQARENIPESKRAEFDAMVPLYRMRYSEQAAGIEHEGRQRFYDDQLKKVIGDLSITVSQIDPNNTKAIEAFRQQGEDLINASGLPDTDRRYGNSVVQGKASRIQEWRQTASEAVFNALKERDPAAAAAALGISPAPQSQAGPSATLSSAAWVQAVRQFEPDLGAGRSRAQVLQLRDDPAVYKRIAGRLAPAGAPATGQPDTAGGTDAASLLRHFEGFSDNAHYDVNAYRAGYGSDTVTRADGSVEQVTKATRVTRDDAERDLARRSQEFANTASGQVGSPSWDRLDGSARAALTSVAYNYGSLPESVVKAVRSGDKESIATAVQSLGSNPSRRAEEAAIIRNGGGPTSVADRADPRFQDIPLERRWQLYNAAQSDARAGNALYVDGIQDYTSWLKAGNVPDNRYSMDELTARLGPDKAGLAQKQINEATAYGQDFSRVGMASPDQIRSILTERVASVQNPTDYRQHASDLAGIAKVIDDRDHLIAKDPAAYVQRDDAVASAYGAMGTATSEADRQAATAKYATSALAVQDHLGVAPQDQRLLPKAYADDVVSRFKNQPEGGQNAATLMRSLEALWGKNWPRVYGELSKDLPGTALVVGAMNLPEQQRASEKLAEAAAVGTEDLQKAVTPDTAKKIRDALPAILEPFASTLAHSPGGARTYTAFNDAVYQLALTYAREGDASGALDRAYQDVLGKAYAFKDTYRVPISIDADNIEAGANQILQNIDGINLALPTSLAGLPEDQTRAAYLDTLKTHGFWVNSPDESGLTLFDGLQPVLAKAGRLADPYVATPDAPPTGLIETGNIDLNKRPLVKNADGSVSTVRSMSFEEDGREILIPTVAADGSRILSDKEAVDQYRKTGQHLGIFDDADHADAYAEALHQQQEEYYSAEPQPVSLTWQQIMDLSKDTPVPTNPVGRGGR